MWGVALWHCPPPMPMWRVDAPGPFPRVARAQYTAPVAFWCCGSRFRLVARSHFTIPAPLGPLAYSGRLIRCLGCPLNKLTFPQPRSQPVHELLHPSKRVSCLLSTPTTTRPPFSKFDYPLTNIKLTPGSLGWESLLPPTSHSHHAYHIRSTHTQARWPSLIPHTLSISQLTPTLYTAILPN